MIRNTLVALALFSSVPLTLDAQRLDRGAERIETAKARAVQAGIPAELLENRIAEGRAKGVSEERIAAAVERRAAGLARAHDALSRSGVGKPTSAELSAGADAIEAGVDAEALRAVIEAAREKGPEDRAMAVAVLGELTRQGIPPEHAAAQVKGALARRDGALAKLPEQAAAARGRRGPPEGAGSASGVGRRPGGVGGGSAGMPGGKPAGVPGGGKPGGGKPSDKPGGKPSGKPGGRP